MKDIIIIGGGAAGMMAGIMLAEKGYSPTIIEKNDKLGRKLFITGKGRCNLTNDCDTEELLKNVVTNSKFLYSAFYGFDSNATMKFFEGLGLAIKTERGNRVFPTSDHSSDVISVMTTRLKRLGVEIRLNTETVHIDVLEKEDCKAVKGVKVKNNAGKEEYISCEDVVVATGGVSYPLTGSTGDGVKWAKELGLDVVEPKPALVPLEIEEVFCKDIMGLALKNVQVKFKAKVKNKEKTVYSDFGEMLFTHYGVSGPVILSASSYLGKYLGNDLRLYIDLKPAMTEEQLNDRLLRDFSQNINKQFRNSLGELLPKKLIPVIIEMSGIDQYKKVNEITKEERISLIKVLKSMELKVTGLRDFNEAIITQGGVSVKEVNPQNMQAKKIKGLRFIGEVLDVDALTGGFNLQIAWSTAAALE
ncbi:MAG: NAD(P)/FAD-dependent oxidoreductase [Lachnospiraceae bacterium]|nr:NAD(P)/FAD-dependent oxidoreductase [Lachnospiraceae bacterium]